jgi:hypothetical protein
MAEEEMGDLVNRRLRHSVPRIHVQIRVRMLLPMHVRALVSD